MLSLLILHFSSFSLPSSDHNTQQTQTNNSDSDAEEDIQVSWSLFFQDWKNVTEIINGSHGHYRTEYDLNKCETNLKP